MADFLSPEWFDQAGKDTDEWFDQAGKDIDQGGQDFSEALQDGAQAVGEALPGVAQVVSDVAQVVGETVQDGAQVVSEVVNDVGEANRDVAQVVYDVFNHANGPSGDAIVDQIESQIPNNSGPSGDGIVDQIESQIGQQSTSDYVVGPDFNNPAPELPSPGFKTFDPLTNPNPGLESSAFKFSEVGFDALSIDGTYGADFTTIEDLQGLVFVGGYDSIDSMNESLMDSMNSIFEVAEIPMF